MHLSTSACLRRVRSLEERGVIRGYRADIDPASIGRGFEVIVHVELGRKDRVTVERFEAEIADFEEVVECRRMFGVPDYLIRVSVEDQEAYERFYMGRRPACPASHASTPSSR